MILDCFTFFNELDLLEVRLHTLAPWVDCFILCEANRTFQGAPKPYVFDQHRFEPRFRTPGKPLISVKADLSPMDDETNAWERERIQRHSIVTAFRGIDLLEGRGLPKVKGTDRIILSDVDEIPDLHVFDQVDPDCPTVISWNQTLYYYWVNMRCWSWIGPVSCTMASFETEFGSDMQRLRDSRSKPDMMIDGGWHFSFLGGPAAIREKIEAFSHTEYRHCASDGIIDWALREGWKKNRDLFGRSMMNFELMPDDSHLPGYMVANKKRFKDWWYRC